MGMSGTEGGSLPGYRFPLWARAMSGVALYATAIFWISQLGYSQYYPDSPAVAAAGTQWRLAFTVGTMAAGAVLSLAAHRVLSHLLSCHLIFCVGALFGVSMGFRSRYKSRRAVFCGRSGVSRLGYGMRVGQYLGHLACMRL